MKQNFKRVLNKLKCKELVSNTLELHIITVRVIDEEEHSHEKVNTKGCSSPMRPRRCRVARASTR